MSNTLKLNGTRLYSVLSTMAIEKDSKTSTFLYSLQEGDLFEGL
jgi:hypothetical protein